jgi:hypothetical protein
MTRFFAYIAVVLVLALQFRAPLAAAGRPHDFHVCILEINHNLETRALEITVKIFTDDIERSIQALGGGALRLGDPREAANADALLFEYLQNRLSITLDTNPFKISWVGKEVELDALWCYLEVPSVGRFSEIGITNRILTEVFEDQANVVHVTASGITQSLFLSKSSLSGSLTF